MSYCPTIHQLFFFFLTYSGGTGTYVGVPFCIAVRKHTQFISLSFSLLIVRLLTQGYLYLTPVPIWLMDTNPSPFNYTVNFDCFMKLIKPVVSLPIDNIKLVFSTESIIFDRWRRHSSLLGWIFFFPLFFYTYQVLLTEVFSLQERWKVNCETIDLTLSRC